MSWYRLVVKRELRRIDDGLPVVVDTLECGHEASNAGPRSTGRLCSECPHQTAGPLAGLSRAKLETLYKQIGQALGRRPRTMTGKRRAAP